MSEFPKRRMRRMRASPGLRAARREARISVDDFICPVFVVEDEAAAGPVASMPGVMRHRLSELDREIETLVSLGIGSVLLFGVPAKKDATGEGAARDDSAAAQAIHRIRNANDRLTVMTDVCLCSYTDHGHCGVIRDSAASSPLTQGGHRGVTIDNDATLDILARTAVAHASAGANVVAPSGMMDGAVAAIRSGLDAAGFTDVAILSYAVKYASSFYGPFRDAADSAPAFGDRRSYQMDPANAREALAEAEFDLREGADAIMVKPAMPYLDVIRRVRDAFPSVPLAAYQVSGEYSMIKGAAERGWLDERAVALESLTAIKRAGADMIITYFAKDAARWLRDA